MPFPASHPALERALAAQGYACLLYTSD
ncbi:hypothetical protein, partial [Caulobacter sp. CCH9-E1]